MKKPGKRKRGILVKCQGSPNSSPPGELEQLSYEKFFCLCVAACDNPYYSKEWYIVNISSKKDKEKEEEEKKGKPLLQIPTAELRGAYLSFHHDERHGGGGGGEDLSVLSPVKELKNGRAYRAFGTCCAAVGSIIYRIGGDRRKGVSTRPWSRKVIYFDASRPEEKWKRGPSTICGRSDTPVVALQGKLYVFGGYHRDFPGVWGEFLDTTKIGGKEGEGEWNPLPDPPSSLNPPSSLGFLCLFAVALGGEYSDKILVLSKLTRAMCFYDVKNNVWEYLDRLDFCGRFRCPPIVVGTTIYWIRFQAVYAYDFTQKTLISMPISDFKICWLLDSTKENPNEMKPTLLHIVGDVFCLFWIGDDSSCVHCTKLRVSTELKAVFVLSCHSYIFDGEKRLLDCLPLCSSS